MSYDNHDYPNRKDRRKPYHKSGRFDRSCRPGGSCPYCKNNREHANKVKDKISKEKLDEQ